MTEPVTLPFGKFVVQFADPATPTVFKAPCGFTTKSLALSATAEETDVPDCDDPDAPSWTARDISSLSGSITGQGVMAMEDFDMWQAWFDAGGKKIIKMGSANPAAEGGGYRQGSAVLTKFQMDGSKGKRCTVSVQIDSDGPWPWTPAAA